VANTKPRANTRHISAMLLLAGQDEIQQGRFWYQQASDFAHRLVNAYGCSYYQAAGVIAALSPNQSWELNQRAADITISAWSQGVDPCSIEGVPAYPVMRGKAAYILNHCGSVTDNFTTTYNTDLIESTLNGPKITSFFRCITGIQNEVCVDGHALSVYLGQRIPTSRTPKISQALYAAVQRSYQLVASRSYDLIGEILTPAQVQAVTWIVYRRLYAYKRSK
jgi:hypothetical protein